MVNIKTLPLGAYQTNCYLVWGEGTDSVVVIDPGYEPEKILAEVARLGKNIAAIFLTHGHFDHVGGVKEIAAETDCPVYLQEQELPTAWYNLRADMKNKPAPLLNSETHLPMTAEDLSPEDLGGDEE